MTGSASPSSMYFGNNSPTGSNDKSSMSNTIPTVSPVNPKLNGLNYIGLPNASFIKPAYHMQPYMENIYCQTMLPHIGNCQIGISPFMLPVPQSVQFQASEAHLAAQQRVFSPHAHFIAQKGNVFVNNVYMPSALQSQATMLPQAFQTINPQDPSWNMDTRASSHLANNIGLQNPKASSSL
ncbi:hypothetical protein Tco_0475357 [Tanacetum coccineum]